MSEMELHIMRNRLNRGRLNKASRGELFMHLPSGYVKTDTGGAALDPDEQLRSTIQLIFDKFDELGSGHAVHRYLLKHDIRVGVRPIDGPNRGQLEWRRPSHSFVFGILKHPMYAGAFAFGRCPVDPKRVHTHKSKRKWVPMEEWAVLLRDCVPAYITWDQFLNNQRRLKENKSRRESKGNPRNGAALLSGIVYCGSCGYKLTATYERSGYARYECCAYQRRSFDKPCRGISAIPIDALVTQQILQALEPASLELSIQATEDLQRERDRLRKHCQQQCERADYEARRAERQYRAVDAENRLVARTLEQEWEATLHRQRQSREEADRIQQATPVQLTSGEQQQIRSLASDIPSLWQAAHTTPADRKEITRCLIERVVVSVRGDTEHADVTIQWAGGYVSQHAIIRPVGRYEQLEDYDQIIARIQEGRANGLTGRQIAEQLNQEGFRSPATRAGRFTQNIVNAIQNRLGTRKPLLTREKLAVNEWWLPELAAELRITTRRLHHWVRKGFVHSRKEPASKFWILWADAEEIERLSRLRDYLRTERHIPYPKNLTQPKVQPTAKQ